MQYIVKGVQKVDYKNKEGRQVTGTNLHCVYDMKSVEGEAVEKIYVSSKLECPIVKVGDIIDVTYNKFGSIESIGLIK